MGGKGILVTGGGYRYMLEVGEGRVGLRLCGDELGKLVMKSEENFKYANGGKIEKNKTKL